MLTLVVGEKPAAKLSFDDLAQGLIFAPDKDWAQLVIDEMATFPKSKHDDLVDSACQAINYLRSAGLAFNDGETLRAQRRPLGRVRKPAIYPI